MKSEKLAPTSASSGPSSHIYFSQRLRLHYVDWGNPDAPPCFSSMADAIIAEIGIG